MKRFALLLAVLTLTGFGCTKPTPPQNPTLTPKPIEEPAPDEPSLSEETLSANDPCPSGTVRYWHTDEWGEGMTFCYEETSVTGLPVTIRTEGNTTILSTERLEQTIVPIGTFNETETMEELIARFMTPENKEKCFVDANEKEGSGAILVRDYDLEPRESCGSADGGSFYARGEEMRGLFYIRAKDGFFPSETWIETLRFVFTPGGNPDATATTKLSWLNTGPLAHYQDTEIGVAFDYPVRWGPILRGEERGTTEIEDVMRAQPIMDCTHQRQLIFSGLGRSAIIGAAGDSEAVCNIGGRGGYFGDISNHLSEDFATMSPCETGSADACDTIKTTNGLNLWHWHYNEKDNFGDIYKNVDEYAVYHKNHPMSGIIFSNERLISAHLDPLTPLFTALVKSIELIPAK